MENFHLPRHFHSVNHKGNLSPVVLFKALISFPSLFNGCLPQGKTRPPLAVSSWLQREGQDPPVLTSCGQGDRGEDGGCQHDDTPTEELDGGRAGRVKDGQDPCGQTR